MSGLGFWFDASACSGCKACQVSCKDKHDLPLGVRWRRVYEVAGGAWTPRDGAWLNDVVAYNVSVACNHCERPICAEVCPAGAITRREDGLVLLDSQRCTGCRYCEWACPYGAPQYDATRGRMTKCTFCVDEVDQGGTPTCVAACTLRAMDFGTLEELEARHGAGARVHPLPDPGLTGPALAVTPHSHAARAAEAGAEIANREEVRASPGAMRERSLVAFTLLAQTAVGMLWAGLAVWAGSGGFRLLGAGAAPPVLAILAVVGPLAALAALLSLLHLGSPRNAWRAVANIRRSWLSREILCLGAFGGAWLALMVRAWRGGMATTAVEADHAVLSGTHAPGVVAGGGSVGLAVVVAVLGVALVYSMSRVYRLRTVPAWNTRLTTVSFFFTAGSLGGLSGALVAVLTSSGSMPAWAGAVAAPTGVQSGHAVGAGDVARLLLAAAAACLVAELILEAAWRRVRRRAARRVDAGLNPPVDKAGSWRSLLVLVGVTPGVLASAGVGIPGGAAFVAVALLSATIAAVTGRTEFYRSHARLGL